jgi:hypothetical protein
LNGIGSIASFARFTISCSFLFGELNAYRFPTMADCHLDNLENNRAKHFECLGSAFQFEQIFQIVVFFSEENCITLGIDRTLIRVKTEPVTVHSRLADTNDTVNGDSHFNPLRIVSMH